MAAKATEVEHQTSPNMTKRSLLQLSSYVTKTLLSQGLLQTAQTTTTVKLPVRRGCPELSPMSSFLLGLSPPHSVLNVGNDKQDWLNLLHLIATHQPAHLQHDYTTILLQVGDVTPARPFPAMWETATMIMLGKYKQGEVWMEGSGGIPCPEVCHKEKHQTADGSLTLANNQFIALNQTTKYSILSAKGERIVVTYILMKPEHIASYQHVLLTKKSFPVPAFAYPFAYPVRKRLTKKGPDPYEEDVDMKELRTCADETLDAKPPVPHRPPEVWEQHERDGPMPKLPDCPVCGNFRYGRFWPFLGDFQLPQLARSKEGRRRGRVLDFAHGSTARSQVRNAQTQSQVIHFLEATFNDFHGFGHMRV